MTDFVFMFQFFIRSKFQFYCFTDYCYKESCLNRFEWDVD